MGTTITCHALAGKTTALKTCLSNVLSKTLPYCTTFGSVSALSLENPRKTYKHICINTYIHDLSPSFHCVNPSGFAASALTLRLNDSQKMSLCAIQMSWLLVSMSGCSQYTLFSPHQIAKTFEWLK